MECQKSSPVWGKLLCWPLRAMNTLTIPSLTFALLVKNTTKWINRVPGDPRTKSLMNLLSNKICGKKCGNYIFFGYSFLGDRRMLQIKASRKTEGASPVAKWQRICLQCRSHKRHQFDPWVRKIPWRRAWQLTPAFLPGGFQGQRSLVGYSPWGHKELDMTEET